jgi:hypothetical protein
MNNKKINRFKEMIWLAMDDDTILYKTLIPFDLDRYFYDFYESGNIKKEYVLLNQLLKLLGNAIIDESFDIHELIHKNYHFHLDKKGEDNPFDISILSYDDEIILAINELTNGYYLKTNAFTMDNLDKEYYFMSKRKIHVIDPRLNKDLNDLIEINLRLKNNKITQLITEEKGE